MGKKNEHKTVILDEKYIHHIDVEHHTIILKIPMVGDIPSALYEAMKTESVFTLDCKSIVFRDCGVSWYETATKEDVLLHIVFGG